MRAHYYKDSNMPSFILPSILNKCSFVLHTNWAVRQCNQERGVSKILKNICSGFLYWIRCSLSDIPNDLSKTANFLPRRSQSRKYRDYKVNGWMVNFCETAVLYSTLCNCRCVETTCNSNTSRASFSRFFKENIKLLQYILVWGRCNYSSIFYICSNQFTNL